VKLIPAVAGTPTVLASETPATPPRKARERKLSPSQLLGRDAIVALHGPHQPNVPIQPAMACPISSGESS
jgi:hypothetical protein